VQSTSSPPSNPPLILALDGSAARFSLALAAADRVVHEVVLEQATASRRLFDALDAALAAIGAARRDLRGLVATRGPGSFTGVRVALSAALGLRLGLTLDAAAVGSLDALAEAAPRGFEGTVVALVDALRGEWFVQAFDGPDRVARAAPGRVAPSDLPLLSRELSSGSTGSVLWVGHGAAGLVEQGALLGASLEPPASLAGLAFAVFRRRGSDWAATAADLARPIYLRDAATTPPRSKSAAPSGGRG
jgi:tRNA threonylcarbamoyladenosine biosynthesis protein TsaB